MPVLMSQPVLVYNLQRVICLFTVFLFVLGCVFGCVFFCESVCVAAGIIQSFCGLDLSKLKDCTNMDSA